MAVRQRVLRGNERWGNSGGPLRPVHWKPPAEYGQERPWPRASFDHITDRTLRSACQTAQGLALAVRRTRSSRPGRSSSILSTSIDARIDNHTLAAIENGTIWPSFATVLSLTHALDIELVINEPEE